MPTPCSTNSVFSKGLNWRTLSIEEMNNKRAKGLCYFCNEKYMLGHNCKTSKQLYLLEADETEELEASVEDLEAEAQDEPVDKQELG